MSAYRPAPEPRQRGPVCMECKHVMHRGNRWDGDQRLVCLADGPAVVSPGRFDYVSGRIVDRVEADPPLCKDLNGEGQCERFEGLRPPTVDPPRPGISWTGDVEEPRSAAMWTAAAFAIGVIFGCAATLAFEAATRFALERVEDSQGERGEP